MGSRGCLYPPPPTGSGRKTRWKTQEKRQAVGMEAEQRCESLPCDRAQKPALPQPPAGHKGCRRCLGIKIPSGTL